MAEAAHAQRHAPPTRVRAAEPVRPAPAGPAAVGPVSARAGQRELARLSAMGDGRRAGGSRNQRTRHDQAGRRVLACRADGSPCCATCRRTKAAASRLPVSSPGDRVERDADRTARQVLRAPSRRPSDPSAAGDGAPPASARPPSGAPASVREVLASPGRQLDPATRRFMEPRFGRDLGDVRVHADGRAASSAAAVDARAYTVGAHIAFADGEYRPASARGRRLLAHELAHVAQYQDGKVGALISRTVHEGTDHGGHYAFDDEACTLTYRQDWFFSFETQQSEQERLEYMAAAADQVRRVWSQQMPLLPVPADVPSGTLTERFTSCPCEGGVTVDVGIRAHEEERQGRRGFQVEVAEGEDRGFAHQPKRRVDLGTQHADDVTRRSARHGLVRQGVIAHEFGHTIGLTDEYHWWASLFRTEGSRDERSIMYIGNEVRPRHYQHFADLLNREIGGGCTFAPMGERSPEYENPLNRFYVFSDTQPRQLQFDRRISNQAMIGFFYPTAGVRTIYDLRDGSVEVGPTVGLRLNQIAHPLFVDIHTGLLIDPADPSSALDLRVPMSARLGLRKSGYELNLSYTAIADILGERGFTHLVGIGLEF